MILISLDPEYCVSIKRIQHKLIFAWNMSKKKLKNMLTRFFSYI